MNRESQYSFQRSSRTKLKYHVVIHYFHFACAAAVVMVVLKFSRRSQISRERQRHNAAPRIPNRSLINYVMVILCVLQNTRTDIVPETATIVLYIRLSKPFEHIVLLSDDLRCDFRFLFPHDVFGHVKPAGRKTL